MTRVDQNFSMYAGRDKAVTFTVTNGTGASKNLTGASVVWILSEEPTSASLVRKSTDSGITVSGCTFTVRILDTDTSGLAGLYHHESWVRDSSGSSDTVAVGIVEIHKSMI